MHIASGRGYAWDAPELASLAGRPGLEVARTLALFSDLLTNGEWTPDHSGLVMRIELVEATLDLEPLELPAHNEMSGPTVDAASLRIDTIELTGYRPFSGFWAQPHDLTVIIGANASGKSSLFDFLRFVSFAGSNPLPPELQRIVQNDGAA
jgi:hypothetical protein